MDFDEADLMYEPEDAIFGSPTAPTLDGQCASGGGGVASICGGGFSGGGAEGVDVGKMLSELRLRRLLGEPLFDFKPTPSAAEIVAAGNARKREGALEELRQLRERNAALSFAALKRFMLDGVQARLEGGLRGLAAVQRLQDEAYAARVASEDAIAEDWKGRQRRAMDALQEEAASNARALFESNAEARAQRERLQLVLEDAHRAYRKQHDASVAAQAERAFFFVRRPLRPSHLQLNGPVPPPPHTHTHTLPPPRPRPQCSPSTSGKRAPSASSWRRSVKTRKRTFLLSASSSSAGLKR